MKLITPLAGGSRSFFEREYASLRKPAWVQLAAAAGVGKRTMTRWGECRSELRKAGGRHFSRALKSLSLLCSSTTTSAAPSGGPSVSDHEARSRAAAAVSQP